MIIFFDLIIVFLLFVFIVKDKNLILLNPLVLYLIIHVFFVTFRGFQLLVQNKIIVSNKYYGDLLSLTEISKAIFLADLGLISFFIGFYLFKNKFNKKGELNRILYSNLIEKRKKYIAIYIDICLIVGVISLLLFGYLPGSLSLLDFEGNTITEMMASLAIISSILLIYEYGFNFRNSLFFILMVIIFSIQGYARYRAILPLLFVLLYYLKLYKFKFPPLKFILLGILIFLISFPLKEIGKNLRNRESIDLIEMIQNSYKNIKEGDSDDLALIEQSGAMIGNMDRKNKIFYGQTYSPVFFFLVPRALWKEKPALNEWQHEISTTGRNFGEMGQVSLITGEAYANFRIPGVIFVLMLLGIFYSYLFFTFSKINIKHKGFLMLLFFDMILFQIWRDGLISIFVFPLIYYIPIIGLFLIKRHSKIIIRKQII
jgi:hypothetical protein